MSDTLQMLLDTTTRLFAELFTPADLHRAAHGEWLADKWQALEEFGLPMVLVGGADGELGIDTAEGLALLRAAASFAVPLPLAETVFANHLLDLAGMKPAAGPASIAPVLAQDKLKLEPVEGGYRLSGEAHAVPWGRFANTMVAVAHLNGRPHLVHVDAGGWTVGEQGRTLCGFPADRLDFAAVLDKARVQPLGDELPETILRSGGAALRTIAIAGALQKVLEITIGYVGERSQFGRTLSKFQVIQHDLARIAEQAVAAGAAAELAAEAFVDGFDPMRIAVAKSRAGEAAGIAAPLAHQLHGAIGVTEEYQLHYFTRQLWAGRDEFGTEREWNELVGRAALQQGPDGLWPFLTAL
ncbi:hypothetical protein LL06_03480 [Hoeflea sp. BAL378]|uniref:acyl-CoA dehydrogenase family protein n=1 Tax=Hoeflea sp. BAL378 TaxID=1547437 RepID=UPI000512C53B|nr:acyl-CoA dehydrogenase family protein [Hoeflea sp. BAL378]KGF70712.1 hypothetical protein LL06_03480 [Hoeflea sp. BAL378]